MSKKLVTVHCECGSIYREYNTALILECPMCNYRCTLASDEQDEDPIYVKRLQDNMYRTVLRFSPDYTLTISAWRDEAVKLDDIYIPSKLYSILDKYFADGFTVRTFAKVNLQAVNPSELLMREFETDNLELRKKIDNYE